MTVDRLELFADYFQFLLMDESCEDDFSDLWSPEAVERMLAVGDRSISFGTLRNVTVRVEVHCLDSRPDLDLANFDHAAEASFSIPSGQFAVLGCTDYLPDARRIVVRPGHYQVLYLASGIESIKTEWEDAEDLYSVFLWPGPPLEPRQIKNWKTAVAPQ